jgi:hypothetical protein
VAFSYQHRVTESSFTVVIKDHHLISMACKKIPTTAGIVPNSPLPRQRYCLTMTLNVLTSYMRSNIRAPHAIDFVLAQGAQNPFPDFDFVWVAQGDGVL